MKEKHTGGPYSADDLPQGRTDWTRLREMSDEEIEAQARADEDDSLWTEDEFAHAELVTPAGLDAEQEMVKAGMAREIAEAIGRAGLTQTSAAARVGLAQPDISKLVRGSVAGFSIERLTQVLTALGQDVVVTVRPATRDPRGHFLLASEETPVGSS